MFAIVNHHGKQYRLEQGRYIDIDRLADYEPEATKEFNDVLMIVDGDTVHLGKPSLTGASVTVKVMHHFRDDKILVYKMRCKKGYRRKNGHRQAMTRVQVVSVQVAS